MNRKAQIRAAGATLRQSLLNTYRDMGDDTGLRLSRRYAWECGDVMAEVHGKRRAAEVIYGVADLLVGGVPLDDDLLVDHAAVAAVSSPPPGDPSVFWWMAYGALCILLGWGMHS